MNKFMRIKKELDQNNKIDNLTIIKPMLLIITNYQVVKIKIIQVINLVQNYDKI